MRTTVLSALLVVALAACTTTAVSPMAASYVPAERITSARYTAPAAGTVHCLFIRDSGMYGAGVPIDLYIDGFNTASFRPSERLDLYLPKGEHMLAARGNSFIEQLIEHREIVEADRSCAFRLGYDYYHAIVQPTSAFKG